MSGLRALPGGKAGAKCNTMAATNTANPGANTARMMMSSSIDAGRESLLGRGALKTDNDLHIITNGTLVSAILDAKVAALDK